MSRATSESQPKSSDPRKTPLGPRGHWLFGTMPQVAGDPLGLYESAWREYGDIVRLRALPGVYFFLLVHPDAIDHVLAKNHKNYRKPDSFNQPASLLAGKGLLTDEGSSWLKRRRLVQPAFSRQRLSALDGPVVRASEAMIERWGRADNEQVLDILPEMMKLSLSIASTTLFSTDISSEADEIGKAYREAFAYVSYRMNHPFSSPTWLPIPRNRRFAHAKTVIDRVVLDLISRRRRDGEVHDDLLAMLMAAQDEETHGGMTDQQVRDEALTLLTAGHETVGAALSWAWYLLSKHPDIQRSLHDEVIGVLGGRHPTTADLSNLPLCRAVFEEAMRLYPPAWGMPRESIESDEIMGYHIPPKAAIVLGQFLTHRHPEFWEAPDQFRPARFLGELPASRPRYAYFPFGGGPRVCIGSQLAMIEAQLVLATVIQGFEMDLVADHPVVPDPTFTLRPKYGVKVILRSRG
jgi:cytochrome P450